MPSKTQRSGCPKRVDHSDATLDKGDLDGYAVWKRILRAVGELQGTGPGPGAQVH